MEKDPIDKLFEEKLRDYSETPDDRVWQHIERSLDKKRRSRKIIPIWWRLGGAAAVLAVLLYLAAPLVQNEPAPEIITDREDTRMRQSDQADPSPNRDSPTQDSEFPLTAAPESDQRDRQEAGGSRASERADSPSGDRINPALRAPQTEVVSRDPSNKAGAGEDGNNAEAGKRSGNAARLAGDPAGNLSEAERARGERTGNKTPVPGQSETEVAEAQPKQQPDERQSIFDAIAENEENREAEENKGPRWSVGPRLAPVYFNSFGQGSPIHSSFVANSKSGNVNLSYGVALSYAVSPRLSIRSGVHKVDYGYDTEEISFSSTLARTTGQEITNIDYSLASRNLVVRNSSEAKLVQQAFSAEVTAEFPAREGRMVQQFGYVEVPLELDFALIDRKLGVHLIGGLSSLFLIDNSVTLESEGNETEMGEANNLNPLNFSTNIGFGLDYQVSPRIRLNLEPVFKYQLNTFSDTAGEFNPYSIGVYSGLNFRF